MFSSIDELKREIEQFEENMDKTNGVIKLLENNLAKLDDSYSKLEDLGDKHKAATDEFASVKNEFGLLGERQRETNSAIESIKYQLQDQKKEILRQSKQCEDSFSTVSFLIEKKADELVNDIKRANTELSGGINDVRNRLSGIENKIAVMNGAVEEISSKVKIAIGIGVVALAISILGLFL